MAVSATIAVNMELIVFTLRIRSAFAGPVWHWPLSHRSCMDLLVVENRELALVRSYFCQICKHFVFSDSLSWCLVVGTERSCTQNIFWLEWDLCYVSKNRSNLKTLWFVRFRYNFVAIFLVLAIVLHVVVLVVNVVSIVVLVLISVVRAAVVVGCCAAACCWCYGC